MDRAPLTIRRFVPDVDRLPWYRDPKQRRVCRRCRVIAPVMDRYQRSALRELEFFDLCPLCRGIGAPHEAPELKPWGVLMEHYGTPLEPGHRVGLQVWNHRKWLMRRLRQVDDYA